MARCGALSTVPGRGNFRPDPEGSAFSIEGWMRLAVEANAMAGDRRGIGRYVRQVLRHAARLRPDLEVILIAGRPADRQILDQELIGLGLTGGRGVSVPPAELRNMRPDVAWYPWSRIRRRVPGARMVVTVHDLAPFYLWDRSWFRRLDRWRRRRRLRRTVELADLILTDSAYSRGDIIGRLGVPGERVRAIALAAGDVAPATGASDPGPLRDRFGLVSGYFLYVGAGDRRKNLPRLLEAYAGIPATAGIPALVLCGPRPPRGASPPGVHWLGRVGDDELGALYRGAIALVQPSLLEGFGLPVLEAMAAGTPVLSSSATSLPEVGGDAALYFDPMDAAAIRSAMERCATDAALRDDLRRRGLEQARRFSWEATARLTVEAFEEVRGRGR